MKKLLLVAVLAVFMLGVVACGGSSSESVFKDMIKVTDEYTSALNKVASKEDLISAMKSYTSAMVDITKRGKALEKEDPKFKENFMKSELGTKVVESMTNMGKAQIAENVMKFMADPEIQKLSKELGKAMR